MERRTIVAIIVVAAVVACAGAYVALNSAPSWPDDDTKYLETKLDAYMFTADENKKDTVTIRYYEDAGDIPYISISEYYKKLQNNPMSAVHNGNGVFTLASNLKDSTSAILDVGKGTISADNFRTFALINDVNASGEGGGNIPFIKLADSSTLNPMQNVTIDLGGYGVKIHTDKAGSDIWMPLETIANLFINGLNYYCEYVGDAVYFLDHRVVMNGGAFMRDDKFVSSIMNELKKETSQELAGFRYNELCLVFDNFYGKPGLGIISDLQAKYGLDYALSNYDDNTRTIKKYLTSGDNAEYLGGLIALNNFLYDGGHTNTSLAAKRMLEVMQQKGETEFVQRAIEKSEAITLPKLPDVTLWTKQMNEARADVWNMEKLIDGFYYYEKGDTAVFAFDSFTYDEEGWDEWYKGGQKIPQDTVGMFVTALKKAETNEEIKNFLIDLSTNTGGYVADVYFIISMMSAADAIVQNMDVQTKWITSSSVQSDINLDGKFDEKDHERQFRFNYALLTSQRSFSSGNMLPVLAQHNGVMILGERSGGGSCNLSIAAAPHGLLYSISLFSKTVVGYGEENFDDTAVDKGAVPDVVLVKENPDGTKDYSGMYDIDLISEKMNEYYAEA